VSAVKAAQASRLMLMTNAAVTIPRSERLSPRRPAIGASGIVIKGRFEQQPDVEDDPLAGRLDLDRIPADLGRAAVDTHLHQRESEERDCLSK
jgi:hypothetical protein